MRRWNRCDAVRGSELALVSSYELCMRDNNIRAKLHRFKGGISYLDANLHFSTQRRNALEARRTFGVVAFWICSCVFREGYHKGHDARYDTHTRRSSEEA